MNCEITLTPIGIIHTPYRNHDEMPIQGRFKPDVKGWIKLDQKYEAGLESMAEFSHAILLYHFHDSNRVSLLGKPFLEDCKHGIFSIRSPHRPNHLGISVIRIINITACRIDFTNIDVLDGTPLLDIKPYVSYFDCFPDAKSGWIDKHFANGNIPKKAASP